MSDKKTNVFRHKENLKNRTALLQTKKKQRFKQTCLENGKISHT